MPSAKILAKAKALLEKISTPEISTALQGPEREAYLKALDRVYGDRVKRMQDMGFGAERFYHGTPQQKAIEQFKPGGGSGEVHGRGVYVTKDPETANVYTDILDQHSGVPTADESGAVIPLRIRAQKTFAATQDKNNLDPGLKEAIGKLVGRDNLPEVWNKINSEARAKDAIIGKIDPKDFSTVVKKYGYDSIAGDTEGFNRAVRDINIIDPKNVRSEFAAFDPRFAKSGKIMAGVSPAANAMMEEQQTPLDYIGKGFDAYTSVKDRFAKALADRMVPPIAYVPKEQTEKDRSQVAGIASMLADPMNAVPGAPGVGLGLMQLMSEMRKRPDGNN